MKKSLTEISDFSLLLYIGKMASKGVRVLNPSVYRG